MIEVIYEDSV